jgi:lipopolysaccharide transport system ATP-binding protein
MTPAIRVEGLSKSYAIGVRRAGGYRTLRESIAAAAAAPWRRLRALARRDPGDAADGPDGPPPDRIWALKDVDFEVEPGEVVGLIGRNGAGKSTLLKILSRITEPTAGRVQLRGRVGSLLEVGTGFHPELTGRENIYLNGAILGMSRRELDRKFDEIVAFAEVDKFLDTPVKRYSSGMYVRLAFAVAAHLELEILVIDEVLAVGDVDFQKKCLSKMGDLAHGGRTVLFVSHNVGLIHRLCDRAVLLHRGQVQQVGPTPEVVRSYLSQSLQAQGRWERTTPPPAGRGVSLRAAWIEDRSGDPVAIVDCDAPFRVRLEYEVIEPVPDFAVGFQLKNTQGVCVFTSLDHDTAHWAGRTRPPGRYRSTCEVPGHLLAPDTYFLTFAAAIINQQTFDTQQDALAFEIAEAGCIRTRLNDHRVGAITPIFDWRIDGPGS